MYNKDAFGEKLISIVIALIINILFTPICCLWAEDLIDVWPTDINFGGVKVGGERRVILNISNKSSKEISLTLWTLGDNVFTICNAGNSSICGGNKWPTIPANSSVDYDIRFKPTLEQQYEGSIKIFNLNITQEVPLKGNGGGSNLPTPAFFADVDGDGYQDEIYLNGYTISVFHPQTGQTSNYAFTNVVYLSISAVKDTDGITGKEIVVLTTEAYTTKRAISIIHDINCTKNIYDFGITTGLEVNNIVDTDGVPGNEIITWASYSGLRVIVSTIHDRTTSKNDYDFGSVVRLSINAVVVDTDGITGKEIVVLTTEAYTTKRAISIIHDINCTKNIYDFGIATGLEVNNIVDTDGVPGNEIITWASYSGLRVIVSTIHDRTTSKNDYDFGNVKGLSINDTSDYDGMPGEEICVHWWTYSSSGDNLIVDRTRSMSTGCNITTPNTYYRDSDNDGYGNPNNSIKAYSLPSGYVSNNLDCDDSRANVHPGVTEVCDGIDNNCNGQIDEGLKTTFYHDADEDGYGNPADSTQACSAPAGYVGNNTDCDDTSAAINPATVWYKDADADKHSDGATLTQCQRSSGYYLASELKATSGDCNDNDPTIYPGSPETNDGKDNDCDGQIDEGIHVPEDYVTIQTAINAAKNGEVILVSDGIYMELINFSGKAITVRSVNGTSRTIIDGNLSGSVVKFISGETSNSVLDGFTIRNGNGTEQLGVQRGGGVYCWNFSSPTIINCTISSNIASHGGGIYCYYSSPRIINSTISDNRAVLYGGGVQCFSSSPTITNCTIRNNSASFWGGGIACNYSSSPNSTINNNGGSENGGGINCWNSSSPMLTNCTISGNTASYYGGGIGCDYSSSPTIIRCTLSNNVVGRHGGGIFCQDYSLPTITNCTIANNTSQGGGGGISAYSSPTIINCTISGNIANDGGGIYCGGSSPIVR